ncbi:hypothetical protein QF047_000518 [Arthrobacter sp. W4I7]|nr:hypothetical protein [Arthrobacter sp. W4I7]
MAVPCWSSWKTGDVQLRAEPVLDFEAARGGDVLEVHTAVNRGEGLDDFDDLFGVLGIQADRPGVHVGELFEQGSLALHHGKCCSGADVAQAQHGRTVGDDGDGVALDGQVAGRRGVLGDGEADAGDAGSVGAGKIVAVAQGYFGDNFQLAAQVHQEGAVRDVLDGDAVERVKGVLDPGGVFVVGGVAGDVHDECLVVGFADVQCGDRGTGRSHGSSEFAGGAEA